MTRQIVSMTVHRKGELLVFDKGCIVHRISIKKGMAVRINEAVRASKESSDANRSKQRSTK
jgi:hypothetical protein